MRYLENEIEITKRAIERYENDADKRDRYENRIRRLLELKEKIR
ncbi:MAG: hypothetical protein N2746_03530 [Deltaproteobacteria bacterium]|nr:hypothetical protein [Deltaproteobacteria bacterium]